jgi:hypothetical protein
MCTIASDGTLQPNTTPIPDLTGTLQVPRAEVTGDVASLTENRPGSTAQQVVVSAAYLDDPNPNSSYTYTWAAPTHPTTGRSLTLVAGGGPDDATATYAAPEAPSADPWVYLAECAIRGNEYYGKSVAKAATVVVLPLADLDADTDVDLDDYALFSAAMFGPGAAAGTAAADLDGDSDCDLEDYAIFTQSFTAAR